MPISLPDHTTTRRRPAAGVTRRAFLRLAPLRFIALPLDLAKWLRCGFSAPALRPG